jgi:hypothetical protein
MASAARKYPDTADEIVQPDQTVRTVVSLAVFIHLFCVFVTLYGGQSNSTQFEDMLKDRLRTKLAFYGQSLGFDTTARFDLTQATIVDVDHRVEFLLDGEDPAVEANWKLLRSGIRGSDRYTRYQRFADTMAMYGANENDERIAILVADVGKQLLLQAGQRISFLRVRRHLVQRPADLTGTPAQQNPNDSSRFEEVYRAQLIDFGDGELRPQKVEERGQVAPPTQEQSPKREPR